MQAASLPAGEPSETGATTGTNELEQLLLDVIGNVLSTFNNGDFGRVAGIESYRMSAYRSNGVVSA